MEKYLIGVEVLHVRPRGMAQYNNMQKQLSTQTCQREKCPRPGAMQALGKVGKEVSGAECRR